MLVLGATLRWGGRLWPSGWRGGAIGPWGRFVPLCAAAVLGRVRATGPLSFQGLLIGRSLAQLLEPFLPAAGVAQLHCHPAAGRGRGAVRRRQAEVYRRASTWRPLFVPAPPACPPACRAHTAPDQNPPARPMLHWTETHPARPAPWPALPCAQDAPHPGPPTRAKPPGPAWVPWGPTAPTTHSTRPCSWPGLRLFSLSATLRCPDSPNAWASSRTPAQQRLPGAWPALRTRARPREGSAAHDCGAACPGTGLQ